MHEQQVKALISLAIQKWTVMYSNLFFAAAAAT